jgi:hypothetical protein
MRVGEIDPADYAADEFVLRRQFQQPARFFEYGVGLHHNRPVEIVALQNRRELMRQKVAAQRRLSSRHPGILKPLDIPEMLVRIDPHEFMINGEGRRSDRVERFDRTRLMIAGFWPSRRGAMEHTPWIAAQTRLK